MASGGYQGRSRAGSSDCRFAECHHLARELASLRTGDPTGRRIHVERLMQALSADTALTAAVDGVAARSSTPGGVNPCHTASRQRISSPCAALERPDVRPWLSESGSVG